MSAECWADPLSRKERTELAKGLASACQRSWDAARWQREHADYPLNSAKENAVPSRALVEISLEMSDLHLDVTERAEVPAS